MSKIPQILMVSITLILVGSFVVLGTWSKPNLTETILAGSLTVTTLTLLWKRITSYFDKRDNRVDKLETRVNELEKKEARRQGYERYENT